MVRHILDWPNEGHQRIRVKIRYWYRSVAGAAVWDECKRTHSRQRVISALTILRRRAAAARVGGPTRQYAKGILAASRFWLGER